MAAQTLYGTISSPKFPVVAVLHARGISVVPGAYLLISVALGSDVDVSTRTALQSLVKRFEQRPQRAMSKKRTGNLK
jgi:hypothetical protein